MPFVENQRAKNKRGHTPIMTRVGQNHTYINGVYMVFLKEKSGGCKNSS
jgi:hypothetical protein